jgi:parallel beta-helix repeat protein
MVGKVQAATVLMLAVLVCSAASTLGSSSIGVLAASGEDITISDGAPVITNREINKLVITGGSPTIQNCTIHNRVLVKAGSPTFIGNVIEDGIHADAKGGPVNITNNEIHARSGFAAIYVKGIHADVTGNTINAKNTFGFEITFSVSSASIRDNEFYGCTTALCTEASANIKIIHNLFFNNNIGIQDSSNSLIANNTIIRNSFGIAVSYLSTIRNNTIFQNDKYNLYNGGFRRIDATNNWWGTTDAQAINQTIYDKKNESKFGEVSFEPFLDMPNPDAPAIPKEYLLVPSKTPSHSQNAVGGFLGSDGLQIAFLAVAAVGVVVAVVVCLLRQKQNLSNKAG